MVEIPRIKPTASVKNLCRLDVGVISRQLHKIMIRHAVSMYLFTAVNVH